MMMRIKVVRLLCMISMSGGIPTAIAQTSDVTGWHGAPWGSNKAAFRTSVVTSKAAIEGHFKTGQRAATRTELVVPRR
jgi:hypothetical protein